MDTRIKRPARTAVSLGLGVALVATAGVVAATPIVSALATQSSAVTPAAARPAPAALHATVVRTALPAAVTPQGQLHGVSCAGAGCTLTAMKGTVDVKAASGTKTLSVWKFADSTGVATADLPVVGASTAGAASTLLEGTVGVPMTIIIHNALSVPVGLSIPQLDSEKTGQADVEQNGRLELHDVTIGSGGEAVVGAAASGGDKKYTFTPNRAGTFTYQAALTDNGSRGVAMGLVGALIVRPSATQVSAKAGADPGAYDGQEDPAAFDDEAVLVYTDVDSAMATDPIAFNMRSYRPDYHLINGQAYPDVPSIGSAPGNVVMVRVVNGSILEKSPTILGTRFNEFAVGTRPLPTRLSVSGRLVQTGDTFDALVTMPDVDLVRYAIYDAPGSLRNGDEVNLAASAAKNAPALGGGFVLIESGFDGNGTNTGAAVKNLAAAGQPGSGASPLSFSADFASSDGAAVTEAELYVDSLATARRLDFTSSVPDTIATTTLPTPCGTACQATWQLGGDVLGTLTSGVHPVWVRAKTGDSAWGPYALIKIRVDNTGPAVTQLTLSDTHTNATTDLDITATLDERTTGGSMVSAGRYWISGVDTDAEPGSAVVQGDLTVNGLRLIASGDATIAALMLDPADTTPETPTYVKTPFGKLPEGTYYLYVQGQDDRDTWGTPKLATLIVDKAAPVTGTITLDPAATNGLQGSASKSGFVRIIAPVTDALSTVTAVDGYLDAVKPAGNANGIYFSKYTGAATTACPVPADCWTADMPLSWLAGKKADGSVPFYVVGTDAAGNRLDASAPGSPASLNLDRTKPSDLSITAFAQAAAYPADRNLTFTVAGADVSAATGTPSGIAYAEWFVGTDPGQGRGTPIPVTAGAFSGNVSYDLWRAGVYTPTTLSVTLRARDAAGNWSQVTAKRLTNSLLLFSNGFEAGTLGAWNLGSTGSVILSSNPRLAQTYSLRSAVRPAAYYAVDLTAAPYSVPGGLSGMHYSMLMSPRGVVTRCATGTNVNTCLPFGATIFNAKRVSGTDIITVQYGRASATSRVMFRVGVLNGSGQMAYTGWTTRAAATNYTVTVDWQAGAGNGRAVVRVNGVALTSPNGSSANRVRTVQVGVANSLAATPPKSGYFLFDTVSIA